MVNVVYECPQIALRTVKNAFTIYRSTALCIGHLREMGVTAVLNAAQGSMTDWNYVNTKAIYYTGVGIEFFGVPAIDLKWYPICNHFQEASNFIEEVIKSKGKYKYTIC